jgi:hypothetical protein
MIRKIAVAALALMALPALAQDKPVWDAELWSMEEGELLVASVTSVPEKDDVLVPTLALMCSGEGNSYRLRYDPGPQPDDSMDWTGQAATFEFSSGQEHIERELQFEAMDGMWAVTIERDDPLMGVIEAGDELLVLMPNGGVSENTFSLKGSTAAIAEMRRSC